MAVKAALTLQQGAASTIGHERIALLEAVGRLGSIAAAARATGLSYKAAWDSLDAIQNLVSQPILVKSTGGKSGGGATLTPQGLLLIETFHRLEAELARVLTQVSSQMEEIGLSSTSLIQGFMMRNSARNLWAGTIEAMTNRGLLTLVEIHLGQQAVICAEITTKSVERLGLVNGRNVAALVKASFITVVAGDKTATKVRNNRLVGTLRSMVSAGETMEITVAISNDKTLVATISSKEARQQNFMLGQVVTAEFDIDHVIVAAF